VIVANNGDAISEHNRDRIFEAFFTTRRDSGRTGMRLAIAQAMLHANGGSIRLLSSDAGAAFEVRFPAA
jgi:signal transduction histidine kinase